MVDNAPAKPTIIEFPETFDVTAAIPAALK